MSTGFIPSDFCKYVLRALEHKGCFPFGFFYLLRCFFRRSIVGDRRCHHYDVRVLSTVEHGVIHFLRRGNKNGAHSVRRHYFSLSRNKLHFCAHAAGSLGEGVAHLSGGMVGDIAHGVNILAGCSRGYEHAFIFEHRAAEKHLLNGGNKLLRLCKAAGADRSAGKPAFLRFYYFKSVFAQTGNVSLRRRIFEHAGEHRRRNKLFAACGEHGRSEHIVGNSVCKLCDDVCRCRRDKHTVRAAPKVHMRHRVVALSVKKRRKAGVFRQCLERNGPYKLRAVLCHNNIYINAHFGEVRSDVADLIRGNSARNTDKQVFPVRHRATPRRSLLYRPYIFPLQTLQWLF